MARPKAAPLGRAQAQGSHVVRYPTLLDVLQSRARAREVFPGVRVPGVGAEQAVELENGRVMHMRAKKEATWQEDQSRVQLENERVMHMRVKKEATWQEDHSGVEHAGQQEDRLQKKPSLVGGGSSSLNVESNGEDLAGSDQNLAGSDQSLAGSDQNLAGSNQNLASEEAVHGCVMPQGRQNFGKHEDDAQFVCTACGRSVAIVEVQAHPVLHVGVCEICYDFLFSSPFTKDNPQDPFEHENECRWCGDGGEVILCDTCPKAFCKPCIKRNFGEELLNAIESPTQEWSCFVCNDFHLETLINDYNSVESLVKTMNRSSRPQKSRTSRESNSRMRSRRPGRRITNETTIASETIATIIARKKENLRRRYPETNFTGFERPKQRQHPQHHFLFAQNNTNREHYSFESGDPIPEVHLL